MFDELKPSKPKTEYLSHQRKGLTEVMLIVYAQHGSDNILMLILLVYDYNISVNK